MTAKFLFLERHHSSICGDSIFIDYKYPIGYRIATKIRNPATNKKGGEHPSKIFFVDRQKIVVK
jgi:hypothetical protein